MLAPEKNETRAVGAAPGFLSKATDAANSVRSMALAQARALIEQKPTAVPDLRGHALPAHHVRHMEQFRAAIAAAGMTPPDEIVADGRVRMFSPNDVDEAPTDAWYVLRLSGSPSGTFSCRRLGVALDWGSDGVRPARRDERARELSNLRAQLDTFANELTRLAEEPCSAHSVCCAVHLLRVAARMNELGAPAGLDDPLATEGGDGTNSHDQA